MFNTQVKKLEKEFGGLSIITLKEIKKQAEILNLLTPFEYHCKYFKDITADIIVAAQNVLWRK